RGPFREGADVQLQAEPGHRPPHRADAQQPRPRARGRAGRDPRTAGRRRSGGQTGRGAIMTTTWRDALGWARGELADHPEQEAEWMIETVSGHSRTELLDAFDERVPVRAADRLGVMLARRRAGAPLQYVLGRWSFRSLDLFVDDRVLIPRPET